MQFTLRSLFRTVGLVALFLGIAVSVFHMARRANWRATCQNNIKMIGLALAMYDSEYHSLPPVYVSHENGIPTVSWRVLASQYIWCDYDFPSMMDFSKPWNGPENSPFINSLTEEW